MIGKPKTKNNGNHALNSLCDYMCQQFTHDAKSLKFGNSGCICIGSASDLKASRLCLVLTMGAKGGRKKTRSFYGQADRKGGREGSAPSALTVSKCEHFGPIFPIIKW